jgi:ABC-2 type transport system ATP-binding protein
MAVFHPAVRIDNVTHVFPSSRRNSPPRRALDHLGFAVEAGEIFGLLGPNGGGKTTLFRILSTALKPTEGEARIFGLDVVQNAADVRRRIGVVFQHPSLDKKLRLRENLMHHGHLYGLRGPELSRRIQDLLDRLRLSDRAEDFVEHLSGGLQRRGEIAKGLLHKPEMLLMDEPSTGLDPGARRDMWDYLGELKQQGFTVLLTTHLMEEAEKCDRLAIVQRGRVVALGTPAELKGRISGDVITVQTREPGELSRKIREKFGGEPQVVDGTVRIERGQGHAFIPQLVEAFPGLIEAVTVGKPTLEDVFIHQTGHRFWMEETDGNKIG